MRDLDAYITGNYGEDQFSNQSPCDICNHDPANCVCPECEVCGVAGDPSCINNHMQWAKWQNALYPIEQDYDAAP